MPGLYSTGIILGLIIPGLLNIWFIALKMRYKVYNAKPVSGFKFDKVLFTFIPLFLSK